MLAHALGNPFNVGRVKEICNKHNLWLIEDTCDALGAEFNGQKCGTFGDIGTLSFNGNKIITTGGGGAVLNNMPVSNISTNQSNTTVTSTPMRHPSPIIDMVNSAA